MAFDKNKLIAAQQAWREMQRFPAIDAIAVRLSA
jgi:hypothetical protein